jgi:hypothetical protein
MTGTAMLNNVGIQTGRQQLDALVGTDVSDIVSRWGVPERSMTLPDSNSVYSWERDPAQRQPTAARRVGL